MTTLFLTVTGARATVEKTGALTAGMVGVPVRFHFDDQWEGLNRLAVFRAGDVKKDNSITDGATTVPMEVLTQPGQILYVGVEGRSKQGDLVIPTVWAEVGQIMDSAQASGDPALAPTPTQFERFMEQVEQVDEKLQNALTQAKESGEFDGVSVTHSWNGTVLTVTSASGTSSAQLKGQPGRTPVKGVDYVDGKDGEKGETPFVFSSTYAVSSATIGFDYFIPQDTMDTAEKTVSVGDLVITREGKLYRVLNGVNSAGKVRCELLAVLKGEPGYTPQKNVDYFDGEKGEPGYTPLKGKDYFDGKDYVLTENDKAEIAELAARLVDVPGGAASWEDLPAPMPAEYLPEGVAFAEKNFLLDETQATEATDPTFGKCWVIDKAPNLTAGETYTILYNGVPYDCVCYSGDDSGLSFAKGAFLMGNFSVAGGANTGEPFAMVVFPTLQIISLDLSGAASARIGIMGREKVMNVYMDTSDADNMTADKTAGEIWNAVKAGNQVLLYVRGLYICAFACFLPGQGALFAYPGIAYSGGEIAEIKGFKGIMVREDKSVLMQP